jgi:hypothetical protein
VKKMSKVERKCLTDGMILQTELKNGIIEIYIYAPHQNWDENIAKTLYPRLHDGIEYALAPYWKRKDE